MFRTLAETKYAFSISGTSLAVQWLRLCASNAGGVGSIPVGKLRFRVPRDVAEKKKLSDYFFCCCCHYYCCLLVTAYSEEI